MLIKNWRDFATVTVKTHDLDPTYDFLFAAKQDKGQDWLDRFSLHYLMFYDMGGAVRCAESTSEADFWSYVIAGYPTFKRGTERRHSRGDLGANYVANLSARGTPRNIMKAMYSPSYTGLVSVFNTHFQGCGFGPYFIWKVMDFQDRIYERPISISIAEALKHCPDEPRKCALVLWPDDSFAKALDYVAYHIKDLVAPGAPDRTCGIPEAETILCMLKGWGITKVHTIGDDVDTKWAQLAEFPEFHKYLPTKEDWSKYERPATLDTKTLSDHLSRMDD
jgi:hypothetical protein